MTRLEVRTSSINGKGIFALENAPRGTRIRKIIGKRIILHVGTKSASQKIANWIGVGVDEWINTDRSIFRFINHSCEPNVAIIGSRDVVAIKDIKKGDEIVMDYSLTDADPYWTITCTCGSPKCRKKIGSIHSVPTQVILEHLPNIPNNFQRVYIENYISTQSGKLA